MCQATSKTHTDSIVIQVSAPGFRLKITGEAAIKALKEIERVLHNALGCNGFQKDLHSSREDQSSQGNGLTGSNSQSAI